MKKAISIVILAAVVAFIIGILTAPHVDPNGNKLHKLHSKDMTGFVPRQPNKLAEYTGGNGVVSPIFYKQASDGSIVEAVTQQLVVKPENSFDEFMNKNWILVFGSLGTCVGVLLFIILLTRGKDNDFERTLAEHDLRYLNEFGPFGQGGISKVLEQLPVPPGQLRRAESGTGSGGYGEGVPALAARHERHTALGSWSGHIIRSKAERELKNNPKRSD